LLAPQDAGDLPRRAQWFIRMDEGEGVFTRDKAPKTLRQMALDAIADTNFYPRTAGPACAT